MDAIQGAVLGIKLPYLAAWNEARRAHARRYDECLAAGPLQRPTVMSWARHVYHIYAILSNDPAALHQALGDRGIATGFHYPIPVHLQPCFAHLGYKKGDFPHTEKVASEELSLPMFAELTDEQIREIASAVKELA